MASSPPPPPIPNYNFSEYQVGMRGTALPATWLWDVVMETVGTVIALRWIRNLIDASTCTMPTTEHPNSRL